VRTERKPRLAELDITHGSCMEAVEQDGSIIINGNSIHRSNITAQNRHVYCCAREFIRNRCVILVGEMSLTFLATR